MMGVGFSKQLGLSGSNTLEDFKSLMKRRPFVSVVWLPATF